jgi:glutathione reductase (NADPH)
LQSAGVELQASGHVRVDDFQNTTAAGVYALGDVSDRNGLTPVAIAAGRKLADRLFGGQAAARLEYVDIPSVIFSHPPIGTVGLSEAEACARYGAHNVRVYESRFTNLYYSVCDERRATEIKVVTRLPDEKLLGIHMIGLAADEVIQGFAVVLKMGGTKADLDRTVAIHPTAGEELVTLTRHRLGAS